MQTQRDINDYQAFYDNSPFEAEAAFITRKHVLNQLKQLNARRILEVGCANAPLFLDFNHADFDAFVVAEPSPIFAKRAQECNPHGEKVKVFNDFVENLTPQLIAYQFDVIIVSGLLHEVEHPDFIMKNIAACCADATKIIVNVPNAQSFHRLLALEMGLISQVTALSDNQIQLQQQHTFTVDSLSTLCESTGFEIIEKNTYFIKPFTHKQMAALLNLPEFSEKILEGLENMIKYMPDLGAHISLVLKKK